MAYLNRYSVRLQVKRLITLDAQNASHAKSLAEDDVISMEDAEKIQAQNATLIAENTGVSEDGQHQLNSYEVRVKFRRNIHVDAEGNQDARHWAEDDQGNYRDTENNTIQVQQVSFLRERTGTT